MMQAPFDDLSLMAYADGELDRERAQAVERAMTEDERIAARVAAFVETRKLAKMAFAAELQEPVPQALRNQVMAKIASAAAQGGADKAAPGGRIIPLTLRRASAASRSPGWALPVAASFAALGGLLVGYLFAGLGEPLGGTGLNLAGVSRTELIEALNSASSGEARALRDGNGNVELIASVRDGGGVLCREFSLTAGSAAPIVAVACRQAGDWQITFAVTAAAEDGGYSTASATHSIDAYLEAIHAGEPLAEVEEKAALAGNSAR